MCIIGDDLMYRIQAPSRCSLTSFKACWTIPIPVVGKGPELKLWDCSMPPSIRCRCWKRVSTEHINRSARQKRWVVSGHGKDFWLFHRFQTLILRLRILYGRVPNIVNEPRALSQVYCLTYPHSHKSSHSIISTSSALPCTFLHLQGPNLAISLIFNY